MHATIQTVIFILVVFTINDIAGKSGDRIRTCTCTTPSDTGYYCAEMKCVTTTEMATCFSGRSTVQMRDGSIKTISEVQIDEEVLVFDGIQTKFEPIYDFIHMERIGIYEFLRLFYTVNHQTNFTSTIELSSNHLIFIYNQTNPVFASEIDIGSKLQVIEDGELVSGEIVRIEKVKSQGFYAPLTPSGTIVINNVVSSNYASVQNHYFAHLVMQPYRWWRMFIGPNKSIGSEINWYTSMLHIFAEKTGILIFP